MALYSVIAFTNSWLNDNPQAAIFDGGPGYCHQLVKIGAPISLDDFDPVFVVYRC